MDNDIDLLTDYVHKPEGPVGYFLDTTPKKPWLCAPDDSYEASDQKSLVGTISPTVKWILIAAGIVILIVVIFAIFGSVQKTAAPTQQQFQKLTDPSRYSSKPSSVKVQVSPVSFSDPPALELPIVDPASVHGGNAKSKIIDSLPQTSVEIRNPAIMPGENELSARNR